MQIKQKILALLFDLDGVVVFTDKYHYLAWKKLADEEGWKFDEVVNQGLRGVSRRESLQVILDHNKLSLSEEKASEFAEKKNKYYIEFLDKISEADLYPGAIEFIKKCKSSGVNIGLCSSSRNADMVLEKLKIKDLFEVIVTGNDITKTKPNPQIFELAAEKLDVPSDHCMVFEDAVAGIDAALNAGMKCLGVGIAENLSNAPDTFEKYEEIDIDVLLKSGHKDAPSPEPWNITEEGLNPLKVGYWESVFALSNGYIGLRGTYDEADPKIAEHASPGMFINSVYDYRDQLVEFAPRGTPTRLHAMINLFDWRIFDLEIEGEKFSPFEGKLIEHKRTLNMQKGILERTLIWESPSGNRIKLESTRLVSMVRRHTAMIRLKVTPLNFSGNISIANKIITATQTIMIGERVYRPDIIGDAEGMHFLSSLMPESGIRALGLFSHNIKCENQESATPGRITDLDGDILTTSWSVNAEKDRAITVDTIGVFHTSFDDDCNEQMAESTQPSIIHEKLLNKALADMRDNIETGFDGISQEQLKFWDDYWAQSDIKIEGNVKDQQAIRYCLFHLRQGNPRDDRRSISANCLTGERYRGLIYWDTEIYVLPFFLYSQPEMARSLLMFRHSILDGARENAKFIDDSPGAHYPWCSITGEDWVTAHYQAMGYHLHGAIAYAIWRYYLQTHDEEFMYGPGAEVLFETARFMESLGGYVPLRDNKFCIDYVIGPDENAECVNNNCYTNMMTAHHFDFAAKLYSEMQQKAPEKLNILSEKINLCSDEPEKWQRAADNMYIPYHEELGIHMQDDSFLYLEPIDMSKVSHYTENRMETHPVTLTRRKIIKQADVVLLMFTLGDLFPLEQKRANYDYYEHLTQHTSSLSPGIHSVLAAEIGNDDQMYAYFQDSAFMDIYDIKHNVKYGVHAAALGATWMAVVNGFAGMRDYTDELIFNPQLPSAWKNYEFNITYRGSRINIKVNENNSTFTLKSGKKVKFKVGNEQYELSKDSSMISLKG